MSVKIKEDNIDKNPWQKEMAQRVSLIHVVTIIIKQYECKHFLQYF